MVGRDGISHKKLHNKTNTMKHVSVVMTVVVKAAVVSGSTQSRRSGFDTGGNKNFISLAQNSAFIVQKSGLKHP